MKSLLFICLSFFLLFSGIGVSAADDNMADRLAGRIVLAVEDKGQAWYVDPVSKKRVFLGRPQDALEVMKSLGLGVSNLNLILPIDSKNGTKKLIGRILLQVENHGEAWYVYPGNLKKYYLGRPQEAFNIMRALGLGISNTDLAKIAVHENYKEH